jgi:hypothetical protein
MRNKYYIVNVPPWRKVYYIVILPGVNLLWGKVYSMTPGLNSGASDGFVVLVPLVAPVVLL